MAIRIGVTWGDPRGVGPEVVSEAIDRFIADEPSAQILLLGPEGMTKEGAASECVGVWDGSEESAGRVAGAALKKAAQIALAGEVDAIVTAPVHKPALHAAGWFLPGQTEILQELTRATRVGMLMAAERTSIGPPLRVLLATTHLPLRAVPERLTPTLLTTQTVLLADALREGWRIGSPRIALCALNPHASDEGLFGEEEETIYRPAVRELRGAGLEVQGPVPADTVFARTLRGDFDAVVAPYHDVGMAAFKTVSFGTGVNVTLGLPFIRTSPDHGVAFDLAGRGLADPSSTLEALRLAARLHSARMMEARFEAAP